MVRWGYTTGGDGQWLELYAVLVGAGAFVADHGEVARILSGECDHTGRPKNLNVRGLSVDILLF